PRCSSHLAYFLFRHPSPPLICTLSLHDALPISATAPVQSERARLACTYSTRSPNRASSRRAAVSIASDPSSTTALAPGKCSSRTDRKSTRLNSSHVEISYAVFCLKKKKKTTHYT